MAERKERESDFDWVTERGKCSSIHVFEQLRAEAKQNVKTYNDLPNTHGVQFSSAADGVFSITRSDRRGGHMIVRFTLADDEISIDGQGIDMAMTAALTLNDRGDCRLKVNGQELDRWQLLKRALEPILFASGDRR